MIETVGISVGGGEGRQSQDCSPSFQVPWSFGCCVPGPLQLAVLLLAFRLRRSGCQSLSPQDIARLLHSRGPAHPLPCSGCLSLISVWAAQPGGGAEVLRSAVLGTRRMRGAPGTDCFSASHSSHLLLPQACQLGIITPFYRGRK